MHIMHFLPPLPHLASELAFKSTIVALSRAMWDLEMVGREVLPPGPCFLYGNHSNNYDPFILNAFTELGQGTAGVMTMEYLRSGILASMFSAAGIVGTQKRVPEPHLIRSIWRMADAGRRIVIFPEGGRRWDGRPAPWIESTAKLFMKMGIPVYPIQIVGSYVGWPRWASFPRPARIQLKVCPAIDFSDRPTLETGLERLKRPISGDENTVDEATRPAWAFRPVAGVSKLLYRDPWTGEFGGLEEVGARTLRQRSGERSWTMQPDSTLIDNRSGERLLTGDLYALIRDLPLSPASSQPILRSQARVYFRTKDGIQSASSIQQVALWPDHISFSDGLSVPFERILYTGLEKNDKIWIMTSGFTCNIILPAGNSVLAWQDVLKQCIPDLNE